MKGVLFHQDSTLADKAFVLIVSGHDSGFELVDHAFYSLD